MKKFFSAHRGMGTQVIHTDEFTNPLGAHVTPIFQSSTYLFPDVATGAAIFKGEEPGYLYARLNNPNQDQLAEKIAMLEGLDLLRVQPEKNINEVVAGRTFSSGMAAVTTAILARVKKGETIIAQESLYSNTYTFLKDMGDRFGIQVVLLHEWQPEDWDDAFKKHPQTTLALAETPANPAMALTDLTAVAEIAHRNGAWLLVDNTFASPFCQRPLTLGADIVIHSTTKYLCGHGLVIGGALVSTQLDFVKKDVFNIMKTLGTNPGPFDSWLTNIGMKTFELRMERHCTNAMAVAQFLEKHPKIEKVYYPGLESHKDFALGKRQMLSFGGMMSFELKGGYEAGESLLNNVRLINLAVSLGNIDSLISHPASSTHFSVPREDRIKQGISDGLVRLSVGVENIEDILEDLDQALAY
jgi:methionine-gamma-lyase